MPSYGEIWAWRLSQNVKNSDYRLSVPFVLF